MRAVSRARAVQAVAVVIPCLVLLAGCALQRIQPAGAVAGSASSPGIGAPTSQATAAVVAAPSESPTPAGRTSDPTLVLESSPSPAVTSGPPSPTRADGASPTARPAATAAPTPTVKGDAFRIGGINLADGKAPLTISHPRGFEGEERVVVTDVGILVSDEDGRNLALFSDIGSWLGTHKVFVYPDTASGRPIVSVHNGMYAGVPLEAEPLRRLLEGPVFDPYPLADVLANLERLIGAGFVIEQGDVSAEFAVARAIRMNAATTTEFLHRAGDLSTLLEPLKDPDHTFLWLMCSTRQPDEPQEVFPARFVLALTLVSEPL